VHDNQLVGSIHARMHPLIHHILYGICRPPWSSPVIPRWNAALFLRMNSSASSLMSRSRTGTAASFPCCPAGGGAGWTPPPRVVDDVVTVVVVVFGDGVPLMTTIFSTLSTWTSPSPSATTRAPRRHISTIVLAVVASLSWLFAAVFL